MSPTTKNKPLKEEKIKWKSDIPLTGKQTGQDRTGQDRTGTRIGQGQEQSRTWSETGQGQEQNRKGRGKRQEQERNRTGTSMRQDQTRIEPGFGRPGLYQYIIFRVPIDP